MIADLVFIYFDSGFSISWQHGPRRGGAHLYRIPIFNFYRSGG